MEDEDMLGEVARKYSCGEMTTGEIKKITADVICKIIENHNRHKSGVSDEIINMFFDNNKKFK